MSSSADRIFAKTLGARLLSEANDLKRPPDVLAADLGWSLQAVQAALSGEAKGTEVQELARRMAEVYPISLASIWMEPDDTTDGVRHMPAATARATARIIPRSLPDGRTVPYFEYWDTAMSRTAPFKPEIVRQLHVVNDSDPANPGVAFNKGHLMHQLTFYVGKVNFYWKIGETPHCAELDTGDSTYLAPFIPHSFTSRDPERPGYIIAVTYAGPVRFALDDFARVGAEAANTLAGSLADERQAFSTILSRHLAAESLSREELTDRLVARGLRPAAAQDIAKGTRVPETGELDALAASLSVRAKDLLATAVTEAEAVVVTRAANRRTRAFPNTNAPSYRLAELARTAYQPQLKAFELEVIVTGADQAAEICHGLHEYIYNIGDADAVLHLENGREFLLSPNDSAYIRPMIGRRFSRPKGSATARLLVVRIPGAMTEAAIEEFGGFDPSGRARVTGETTRWY